MACVILVVGVKKSAFRLYNLSGSDWPPRTIATASVSPIARAMHSTTAVARPVEAAGIIAFDMVCHLDDPRARLASRTLDGTARMASIDTLTMVGMIITTRTMIAAP